MEQKANNAYERKREPWKTFHSAVTAPKLLIILQTLPTPLQSRVGPKGFENKQRGWGSGGVGMLRTVNKCPPDPNYCHARTAKCFQFNGENPDKASLGEHFQLHVT